MFEFVTSLTEASRPALWGLVILIAVPMGVALFHPNEKRSRRAHAILRDILNFFRGDR